VFGRLQMPHVHSGSHPVRRQIGLSVVVAALLALLALLLLPPRAHANFVYWANADSGTIGRAKINGTGLNNAFIAGLTDVHGVAVDSKFIYWTQGVGASSSIGRANLDGSGVNTNFIPNSAGVSFPQLTPAAAISVTPTQIYWANGGSAIATANIDGSGVNTGLVNAAPATICGVATDQSFVYWLDTNGNQIGRATLAGGSTTPGLNVPSPVGCGLAVDSGLFWGGGKGGVGRFPGSGGSGAPSIVIPSPGAGFSTTGVAVQSQYIFWANNSGAPGTSTIGRANPNLSNVSQGLIPGLTAPTLLAAAPSNKITIDSITKKTSKGTAIISAKLPGPGQVTLNQVSTPPDVNATAAAVKQVGLTITVASSFQVPVKPVGKTAKKLNKQIKKQLRKKRNAKAKAKAKQTVYIHFVPSGVAGVPNTQQVNVTLVRQKAKKKH
jgi:hypothetical protein